jgi:hypothetical protein
MRQVRNGRVGVHGHRGPLVANTASGPASRTAGTAVSYRRLFGFLFIVSIGGLRNSTLAIAPLTARREYPTTGRRLLNDRLDTSALAGRAKFLFGFRFFSFHCNTTPAMDVHQLHFAEISQSNVRSNLERLG